MEQPSAHARQPDPAGRNRGVDQDRLRQAVEAAEPIDGWMNREELSVLAELAAGCDRIVEIGSWLGRSTKALVTSTRGVVIAVDTWQGSPEHGPGEDTKSLDPDTLFDRFQRNLAPEIVAGRVIPVRLESTRAVGQVGQHLQRHGGLADLIFIDASHTFDAVRADILAYLPLLRPGGVMAGHDYAYRPVRCAVRSALTGVVQGGGQIWIWRGSSTGGPRRGAATAAWQVAFYRTLSRLPNPLAPLLARR